MIGRCIHIPHQVLLGANANANRANSLRGYLNRNLCGTLHSSSRCSIPTATGTGPAPATSLTVRRTFSNNTVATTTNTTATATNSTTGASQRQRLTFFAWYSQKLDTHPLLTKSISAFFVTGFGNFLSQAIAIDGDDTCKNKNSQSSSEYSKNRPLSLIQAVDWPQAGRFALLNGVLVAPVLHYWYNFLSKAVPGTTILAVIQRVAWDEFFFTPIYLPIFLSTLWALEGSPIAKIPNMVYEEVPSILVAEWTLWIPTMAFTFRYVPLKFQVLMINSVGILWYTFLSYTAKKAHTKHGHTPFEEMAVLTKSAVDANGNANANQTTNLQSSIASK